MMNESRKGGKLEAQLPVGPYTVAEDLGKGRYRLQDAYGLHLKTAINCNRLKIWRDPESAILKHESVSYIYRNWCTIM